MFVPYIQQFEYQARVGTINFDSDTNLILEGLNQKQTFAETFDWWSGPWCGQVPFYRPIISQLMWVQFKLFGDQHVLPWTMVTLMLHCVALVLAFLYLESTFGTLVAAVSLALFALPMVPNPTDFFTMAGLEGEHSYKTVGLWKNQPEPLLAITLLAGLLCFKAGRFDLALLAAILAPLVKETGFTAMLIYLLAGWYHAIKAPRRFWLLGIGCVATLFFARYLALGTFGYSIGANKAWWWRAILYYAGPIGQVIVRAHWPFMVAGVGSALTLLLAVALRKANFWKALAAVLCSILTVWVLAAYLGEFFYGESDNESGWVPFTTSLTSMFIHSHLLVNVSLFVLLGIVGYNSAPGETKYLFGLNIVLAISCYFAPQILKHAFYNADLFRTALIVVTGIATVRFFVRCFKPLPPG